MIDPAGIKQKDEWEGLRVVGMCVRERQVGTAEATIEASYFIGSKVIKPTVTPILPGRILTADSTASSDGKGSVNRQEALQTNVAAVVNQLLPNGLRPLRYFYW